MWYRRGTGTLVPHVVQKGHRDLSPVQKGHRDPSPVQKGHRDPIVPHVVQKGHRDPTCDGTGP